MVDLSVVIPIRNEASSLPELVRELTDVLTRWDRPYEVIVIDDGSTDESFEILSRMQAVDSRLRVIRFRRNFGQTAAFAAGFDHARGRFIVTMDGDLQNDPGDIPAMVAALERGADIVCGWRKERKDPFFNRRLPSMMANGLISAVTHVRLHDYGCSLKAFRAEIVKPMKLYGEMHRFLPAIASEQTSSIIEMAVNHRARKYGRSKYGIGRTVRVVLDLLTVKFLLSYSTRPLQLFGLIGGTMTLVGAAISVALAVGRLMEQISLNRHQPLLLLGIVLIMTGVQLMTIGLVAELQARTYHESQNKPTYVIREIRQTPVAEPLLSSR
ncbi:MAG TPA: glycosyltransferase family 2 protein [Vicinamibacterales bacterium]|nr:glycosyltransferase family 2 protein [Vicinamibacterales bacterium]